MGIKDIAAVSSLICKTFAHPLEALSSIGPSLHELTFGHAGSSFTPERDIGDLVGKVVFVTGGNAGLGKETILQLAKHRPDRIYLAARSEDKARIAIASIQENLPSPADIRYIQLDLASFKSIRSAATQFLSECERLDILVLNAGVMGSPALITDEGYEVHMGTNHIGHFLLTNLLFPALLKTAERAISDPDVRVITVASLAHKIAPPLDVMLNTHSLLEASAVTRYGASKAANILFTSELARRYPKIMSVSVHPGVISSDLFEVAKSKSTFVKYVIPYLVSPVMRSVRTGAMNQLFAAGGKRELLSNGAYYTPIGMAQHRNRFTRDEEMSKKLWEWTELQVFRE